MDLGLDAALASFIKQYPNAAKWILLAGLVFGGLSAVCNAALAALKMFGKDGGKAGMILRKALILTMDLHSFFDKVEVPPAAGKAAAIVLAVGFGLCVSHKAFADSSVSISHGPTAAAIGFRLGQKDTTQLAAGLGYQVQLGFFPKAFPADFPLLGNRIWDMLDVNGGAIGSLVPGSSAVGQTASLAPFLGVGTLNGILSLSVALDALGSYGGFLNGKVSEQNVLVFVHTGINFDFSNGALSVHGEAAPKRGATLYAH